MTGHVSLIAPIFQVQTFQNCQNFDCHLLKGEKFKLKACMDVTTYHKYQKYQKIFRKLIFLSENDHFQ